MNISPEEATQALREIEASRSTMRTAIQSHRGHYYLWLWGLIWMATSAINWLGNQNPWIAPGLCGVGLVLTFAIAFLQGRQLRARVDKKFVAVCIAALAFGYIAWPIILGPPHSYKAAFGFGMVVF